VFDSALQLPPPIAQILAQDLRKVPAMHLSSMDLVALGLRVARVIIRSGDGQEDYEQVSPGLLETLPSIVKEMEI
jgi:hypothetical protein